MWRAPRIAFAFLVASWGLFLSLQWGDPFDETEHCHVAWLMGHERQKPLRDFFQHHQAPLWDVLKTFYLLGGQGPEVLYFGRVMVLTCALLSALGILLLGRWFARLADPDAPVPWDAGVLGLLPVVVLSVVFQNVLVIRPETLSMPLFLLGALLWLPGADAVRRAGHWVQPFLAGMLVGAAVYTSPRFAPLAGSLLLLPTNRQHIVSFDWRRFLTLAMGAFAFGGIYSVVTSHTIAEVDFNLRFTRLMAPIGHGNFATAPWLVVLVVLSTLLGTFLNACLARSAERRFLLQSAFLLVLAVVSLVTCWPYLYPHNFFPVALWFGVMMASAHAEVSPEGRPKVALVTNYAAVGAGLACLACLLGEVASSTTIQARVRQKRALLDRLRPGDQVLMAAPSHPIAALDASYYGNPIVDYGGRLQAAVKSAQSQWHLPDCNYLADIRAKQPAIVDRLLFDAVAPSDRPALERLLASYVQIFPDGPDRLSILSSIYCQNQLLARGAARGRWRSLLSW